MTQFLFRPFFKRVGLVAHCCQIVQFVQSVIPLPLSVTAVIAQLGER